MKIWVYSSYIQYKSIHLPKLLNFVRINLKLVIYKFTNGFLEL